MLKIKYGIENLFLNKGFFYFQTSQSLSKIGIMTKIYVGNKSSIYLMREYVSRRSRTSLSVVFYSFFTVGTFCCGLRSIFELIAFL